MKMFATCVPVAVKARRLTAVSAGLLAVGLILFLFVHPTTQHGLNRMHGLVGLFLGMSAACGAVAVKLRVWGDGRD